MQPARRQSGIVVPSRPVRIYGLTGGIASGKSSVALVFRKLGASIIDADQLARELVQPGSAALMDIVKRFGKEVLHSDGSLDRQKLGAVIFADAQARQALNQITHPRIAAAGQEALRALALEGETLAIYEAALIVENGLHESMNGLIVVSLPVPAQLERLQAREGIDREAAELRMASQLPMAEKLKVATYVIDNSGSPLETERQVASLWKRLQAEDSRALVAISNRAAAQPLLDGAQTESDAFWIKEAGSKRLALSLGRIMVNASPFK